MSLNFSKNSTTGCPKVRGHFDTPSNSGPGWRILISFDVVIAEWIRFFLMYNTWCFMNLAPPKILAENKVNISQIHCMERAVKTWVGRHCGRLLGPLRADLAKILHGKRARVWQQMIGISLMCVDVRGRSGWKTVKKPTIFAVFNQGWPTLRPIARPSVGRSGRNFTW